jgi:hypothetical protein
MLEEPWLPLSTRNTLEVEYGVRIVVSGTRTVGGNYRIFYLALKGVYGIMSWMDEKEAIDILNTMGVEGLAEHARLRVLFEGHKVL